MNTKNQTEGQPQVATTAGLGVGARLVMRYGVGAEEAVIQAVNGDMHLVRFASGGSIILTEGEMRERRMIVLPPKPAWWKRFFTPNDALSGAPQTPPRHTSTSRPLQ